jgi:DNA invertase Pin-like site-specific DNA recombinase
VASCREVIVETASTRGARPKLHATLAALKPGDTLVIYKPDRIARSMKELLVLLEDGLHAREVNLEILTGICAGLHKPNGQERTLDGLAAAAAQGRRGGRPVASPPSPSTSRSADPPSTAHSPRTQPTDPAGSRGDHPELLCVW